MYCEDKNTHFDLSMRAVCFYGTAASLVVFLLCTTHFSYEDHDFDLTDARDAPVASSDDSQSNEIGRSSLGWHRSRHLLKSEPNTKLPYATEGRIVGFFNLFEKDSDVFSRIVNEQLASVNDSGALNDIAFISYVYFGPNHLSFRIPSPSKKYIKSPKSNVSGNELDTLQLLHEHCVQHPKDRVFYIHTKGSYHPRYSNDVLRRNLMKAVVFCIKQSKTFGGSSQGGMDVCGLRVSPVPYPQLSGNMWLARCAHVARLPTPQRFRERLAAVKPISGCPAHFLGTGRFAGEFWILAHPAVIAVDVLPLHDVKGKPIRYAYAYSELPSLNAWVPIPAQFPRPGLTAGILLLNALVARCANVSYRMDQYRAAFGPAAATTRFQAGGLHCAWLNLTAATLGAAAWPEATTVVVREARAWLSLTCAGS